LKNRYFIHLGFKGTNYFGWQVQPNSITVQEVLNQSLSKLLREEIYCIGAGRTDTGVHAPYFFAHFDSQIVGLEKDKKVVFKLNCILPKDIVVYSIVSVATDAHARFDAISRTYLYRISQVKDPFSLDFTMLYTKPLHIDKMNQACAILMEYTDFTSFSKLHTDVKTNNCKINKAIWTVQGTELHFIISADRFLRNMVRAIVGTMIEVGSEKIVPSRIRTIIEEKNRSAAGTSVDGAGLHLIKIEYPYITLIDNHLPNSLIF
jgi:tRNA pseudouridine38-40 synthase